MKELDLMVIFRFATAVLLLMFATQSQAFDFSTKKQPTDNARLLTLEEGENETSPLIHPDASAYPRKFLATSWKRGKSPAISRRVLENGDPLNIVIGDDPTIGGRSFGWDKNGDVYFLSSRAGSLGLWSVAADGQGAMTRLIRLNDNWIQPVLLADGSLIAVRLSGAEAHKSNSKHQGFDFFSWETNGQKAQIVHISKDGNLKFLTEGINPAVSADGKKVVFSMPAGRSMHLFSMDIDGNNLTQLTHDRSADVEPSISADGHWIAFTSNRGDADMRNNNGSNWDIWVMDSEGRGLQRLTQDQGKDGSPVFAGDSVYFHSDRKVDSDLKSARNLRGNTSGFHIWRIAFQQPQKH